MKEVREATIHEIEQLEQKGARVVDRVIACMPENNYGIELSILGRALRFPIDPETGRFWTAAELREMAKRAGVSEEDSKRMKASEVLALHEEQTGK